MADAAYSALSESCVLSETAKRQNRTRDQETKKKKKSKRKHQLNSLSWSETGGSEVGGINSAFNAMSFMANSLEGDTDSYEDDDASPNSSFGFRSTKKPIPEDLKDRKYFERRRRNNFAARKCRKARKSREDELRARVIYLEQEHAILTAHVSMMRDEVNLLRICQPQKRQNDSSETQSLFSSSQTSLPSSSDYCTSLSSPFSSPSVPINAPFQQPSQYPLQMPLHFPLGPPLSSENTTGFDVQSLSRLSLNQSRYN